MSVTRGETVARIGSGIIGEFGRKMALVGGHFLAVIAVIGLFTANAHARACTVDDYKWQNECLSKRVLGLVDGLLGLCNLDCDENPNSVPTASVGADMRGEAVSAVGNTIAKVPGAVVGIVVRVGNEVRECVSDPLGGYSCVTVGVMVGGTMCSALVPGCAPVMLGVFGAGGVVSSTAYCAQACLNQDDPETCQQACSQSFVVATTTAVAAGRVVAQQNALAAAASDVPAAAQAAVEIAASKNLFARMGAGKWVVFAKRSRTGDLRTWVRFETAAGGKLQQVELTLDEVSALKEAGWLPSDPTSWNLAKNGSVLWSELEIPKMYNTDSFRAEFTHHAKVIWDAGAIRDASERDW